MASFAEKITGTYRQEPSVEPKIPYSYHVTNEIISTLDGSLITVFKISGRTHECASDLDLWNWHRDLNQLFKTIGTPHMELWTHMHHRPVTEYPDSVFQQSFARMFDRSYRQAFQRGKLMVNDLYLTLVYNPIADLTQRVLSKMERVSPADLFNRQKDGINALEEAADLVTTAMKSYGVERLGIYYRDKRGQIIVPATDAAPDEPDPFELDDDDDNDNYDGLGDLLAEDEAPQPVQVETKQHGVLHAYSSALEWFGFLVNAEHNAVPVCRDRIKTYLPTTRPTFGGSSETLQIRRDEGVIFAAGIELRDYPENLEPGQLNILMEADFEFVLTQSFTCLSVGSARTLLTRQQAALLETGDSSVTQIAQISTATDDVQSGRIIMGQHHLTIHVYADNEADAFKHRRAAVGFLNQCAIASGPITMAAIPAWYAKLPGNGRERPRPTPVSSANLACLSSFHNFMSGKPNGNPWGQAVTMFRTTAKTPLFFNWHSTPFDEDSIGSRPAGHGMLLGKTGSGKTTLLAAILCFLQKYNPRMFIYDKDQGMFPLVKALGGNYTVLREGEPSGWQPLQMEPTRRNVAFVKRLVRMLAQTSLGRNTDLHPLDVEAISEAVDAVMGDVREPSLIPREERTLSAVVDMLPKPSMADLPENARPTVSKLLERWCQGGEHGWLFDNPKDSITLREKDIHAFDLTDFIVGEDQEPPETRAPMLLYLLFRVRESIDGSRRVVQVFDEFAQYLDDPILAREIKYGLKTDRKKDTIYLFATQEPNDALDSTIGKTIMQAVVTLLLLYNPEADPQDYIKGLKLTEAEYDRMLTIPENSRQFLVKQGGASALATMNLAGMKREISILSGTPDNAVKLREIMERLGTEDPDVWLQEYWKEVAQ